MKRSLGIAGATLAVALLAVPLLVSAAGAGGGGLCLRWAHTATGVATHDGPDRGGVRPGRGPA
jgi:hypothetical protein